MLCIIVFGKFCSFFLSLYIPFKKNSLVDPIQYVLLNNIKKNLFLVVETFAKKFF